MKHFAWCISVYMYSLFMVSNKTLSGPLKMLKAMSTVSQTQGNIFLDVCVAPLFFLSWRSLHKYLCRAYMYNTMCWFACVRIYTIPTEPFYWITKLLNNIEVISGVLGVSRPPDFGLQVVRVRGRAVKYYYNLIMYRKYVLKWLLKRYRIICPDVAVNGQFCQDKREKRSFEKFRLENRKFL